MNVSMTRRYLIRGGAIARCTATADVRNAVLFARTHGLELAVKGGGHDIQTI